MTARVEPLLPLVLLMPQAAAQVLGLSRQAKPLGLLGRGAPPLANGSTPLHVSGRQTSMFLLL